MNKNWTITFNDGSTATYFNMNLLDALNVALADWLPVKRPVAWVQTRVDIWNLSLD